MGIQQILHCAFYTPGPRGVWGLPLLFEGRPGTAKTATMENFGAHLGFHVESLIASVRAPEDFGGIPIPHTDMKSLVRLPDAWVKRVLDKKHAIVFFDEFNLAPQAVQHALLRVINERTVGDEKLPLTVRMVAAQNSVADGGGGDLTPAMANRFGHLPWQGYSVQEWADWLLGGMGVNTADKPLNPEVEEARVMGVWNSPFSKFSGAITSFLRRNASLYHAQPDMSDPNASKAFPSPRTWELAIRALTGAEIHGLNEADTDRLFAAFVGTGAALEFKKWVALADLPDPEDLLDGKIKFAHNPHRLDRTEAVLSSCAAFVLPTSCVGRKERAARLWTLIGDVAKDAWDIAVPACSQLVLNGLAGMHIPESKTVMVKINPILTAGGVGRR